MNAAPPRAAFFFRADAPRARRHGARAERGARRARDERGGERRRDLQRARAARAAGARPGRAADRQGGRDQVCEHVPQPAARRDGAPAHAAARQPPRRRAGRAPHVRGRVHRALPRREGRGRRAQVRARRAAAVPPAARRGALRARREGRAGERVRDEGDHARALGRRGRRDARDGRGAREDQGRARARVRQPAQPALQPLPVRVDRGARARGVRPGRRPRRRVRGRALPAVPDGAADGRRRVHAVRVPGLRARRG